MSFFFFNDAATTEIYTLTLHDALPISEPFVVRRRGGAAGRRATEPRCRLRAGQRRTPGERRSARELPQARVCDQPGRAGPILLSDGTSWSTPRRNFRRKGIVYKTVRSLSPTLETLWPPAQQKRDPGSAMKGARPASGRAICYDVLVSHA